MGFTRFLLLLRARLPLIAAVTLLVTLASVTVSLLLPARYYAEATAVLEQPAADPALAMAGSAGISYFLATQRDVVASRSVAQRVIENLGMERDLEKTRSLLSGWNPLASLKSWVGRLLSGEREARSQREWLTERLLQGLSVTSVRDSRLLKVGFKSRDPEFSAEVANGFMRAFMEVNVQLKATPARAETAWLEGQLKSLRETLAQSEANLSKFQQEKGIVATDEKLDTENLRLADLSTQLAGAQAETYSAEARRKQLQQFASKGGGADVPAEVIASPVVMQLRQEVAMREAKIQDMSRQLGPNHPRYQAAQGELAQLRGQLSSEMRSVAQGLVTAGSVAGQREASLRGALEEQKNRLLGLKKDREQMSMLARDVENAQKAYNGAVQRISQSRIEGASERPNASVVDAATVPTRPSGPRLLVSLAAGGLLGAVLGLGLALLLEVSQRLVRSAEDLTELLGVPILAVLPARAQRSGVARALTANVVALPKP
jgi:succinoglycan biosynthesis transport protein ExoP